MKIKDKAEVVKVSFGSQSNDGYIKIRLPYGYGKIEGKLKAGDRIKLTIKKKEK